MRRRQWPPDAAPKSSVRPATACVLPKGRRSGGYQAPNSPDKAAPVFPERIAGGVNSVVSVVLSGGGGRNVRVPLEKRINVS
jgi:hypothetical protein